MLKVMSALFLPALIMTGCSSLPNSADVISNSPKHPVLTHSESQRFDVANYFTIAGRDSWQPQPIMRAATPYVVGASNAPYQSVQSAVNAALAADTQQPIAIKVLPGRYVGTIYIPQSAPPLTIYGAGNKPQDVVLSLAIDSMISPAQYRQLVNQSGRYQAGDPAWGMYHVCASLTHKNIATTCSAVLWSQSDRFALANLTVENSLLDSTGPGTHQGVALRTDGDKVRLNQVRLIGRQDTFFVNNADVDNRYNTQRQSRVYIKDSFIAGDVDYVFGRAHAVFDQVEFQSVSSRGASSAYVFAPNTMSHWRYGFLVINSHFSCNQATKGFQPKLGRAWDQGASHTGYRPGHTANGQLLIMRSHIDRCYDLQQPWGSAATTNRPFRGNASAGRDLNDLNYNRLWLYDNQLVSTKK
ncbi:putative acyl-CoA thioester hydrolase [Celerinatantimonas yamalensis]|uniref:Pectinesterase n=1 Tax=Celerinatantimonas yamalensis TaxID=559956 RepID=A0ABW9G6R6_9GAMM